MATQAVVATSVPIPIVTPSEPTSFRSEAEIKALRILDEIEDEQNQRSLREMSGKRCARRQLHILSAYDGTNHEDVTDWEV